MAASLRPRRGGRPGARTRRRARELQPRAPARRDRLRHPRRRTPRARKRDPPRPHDRARQGPRATDRLPPRHAPEANRVTATITAPGSPAAGLTRSSAQRDRALQGSPTGPSAASRKAVPLTARPREATQTPYHPYQPPMSPETGCVIHAQISEKDSDTGHG